MSPMQRRVEVDRSALRERDADAAGIERRGRLDILYEIARDLLSCDNPESFLAGLYPRLADHLALEIYCHYRVDPDTQSQLRLVTHSGLPEEVLARFATLHFGEAVCGRVAQTGKAMVIEDVQGRDEPYLELIRSLGITAYACLPLMGRSCLRGTLSFGTRQHVRFDPDALAMMQSVADLVAVAIDRWEARRELNGLNATLEQRVAERTVELERQHQRLRQVSHALTQAEQQERRRLSQLLHDHLQQLLVAAKMTASRLGRKLADDADRGIHAQLESLLDESISATRSLSAELSPSVLHTGGLGPALEWLGEQMKQKHDLKVWTRITPDAEGCSEGVQQLLFHATRELLFNVVKHAAVDEAHVELVRDEPGHIRLSVKDNGEGFAEMAAKAMKGSGLANLRQRVEMADGELSLESAPRKGTHVIIRVPPQAPGPVA